MEAPQNIKDGKLTAGNHVSYWFEDLLQPLSRTALDENLTTDVVIIGGGIAGVSIAYCLSEAGRKVILVEDGFIGSGETGRTTAHLVTALDDRYYHLADVFGEDDLRLIAGSHKAAIDFIESTVIKEKIDCDFERVDGYLFLDPSDTKEAITKEFEAARKAGLEVSLEDQVPGLHMYNGRALRFANQAQFHPLKYLTGLCKAIEANGGRIFTETHAADITHEGITTDKGFKIEAQHVVIATNSPVNNKYAIHLKQSAYRTYVIGALVRKGEIPTALWWDTGDHAENPRNPHYHYVRLHSYNEEFDILISGGEDHPTGDPGDVSEEERYERLKKWTHEHFSIDSIIYKWSGQVLEPMDSLAFIGRNVWDRDNVYIATGDSGNGMTHGVIAGLLIRDLVTGKENEWEKIYKPSRFTFKESGPFFSALKGSLTSLLKGEEDGEETKLSAIRQGEAGIVELEGDKFAVFKDKTGRFHIVSAICPHLKCTVGWNPDELTWDCPCHGSRFTYEGKVINGPANSDLPYYLAGDQAEVKLQKHKK